MVIYEVNLAISTAIAARFSAWLDLHIKEMLALPGFLAANRYDVESIAPESTCYCVHYRLQSDEALDAYFAQHAERMRGAAIALFGDQFSASRRILRTPSNAAPGLDHA